MDSSDSAIAAIRSSPWLGAEASRNGLPLLIRARELQQNFVGTSGLPFLLVATCAYETADDTGLPTDSQYEQIRRFESDAMDVIEARGIGVVTFIRTWAGTIRYFIYAANIDEVQTVVGDARWESGSVEFAIDDDPLWSEYRRLYDMIKPM